MAKQYIMTLMAVNRVGVLSALTTALDDLGGNLIELSQAVMRGFFTMIVAVEFPPDRDPDLILEHIRSVCGPFGVEIAIKDPDEEMMPEPPDDTLDADRYILSVTGPDQKGALRQITRRLAQEGVDIVDLHGIVDDARTRFSAFMELIAPAGVDVLSIVHELQASSMARNLLLTIQHRAILQATSRPEPPTKAKS